MPTTVATETMVVNPFVSACSIPAKVKSPGSNVESMSAV